MNDTAKQPRTDLVLHTGGYLVDRQDVIDVPTPAPVGKHFPIAHNRVLTAVEEALIGGGRQITEWRHALSNNGARYFGVLKLEGVYGRDNGGGGYSIAVGVRNAHDQSWAASIVAGCWVFVCDNLSFNGEVKLSRKHTRFIGSDLQRLAAQAVGRLGALHVQQDERIALYREAPIDNRDAHDLIVRAIDAKVLPFARVPDVLDQWRTPPHEEFEGRNVWSLYNGFTEVLKAANPLVLPGRTEALHGVFDLAASSLTGRRVRSIDEIGAIDADFTLAV